MDTTKDSAPARSPEHPETLAGDPIAYAARIKAQQQLLEAAEDALAWFERFDTHAPEGLCFGGEAQVRKALREALRKVRGAQ